MNLSSLDHIIAAEPSYRLTQIKQAVWHDLITSWDEAANLPLSLRERLKQTCPLDLNYQIFTSRNSQSSKALITLADGQNIETVLMKHGDGRRTACVSSQIGCALGCTFCATGRMGFRRDLTADEIVSQALLWNRYFKSNHQLDRVNRVVFMGMGEPLLNYSEVMAAIQTMNDPDGFNLGARKISISTVGIVPGINQLAKENFQVNLAISLHAPTDRLRSKLIPAAKRYPIKKILAAVDNYISRTNRQVMFEYLMIKNVNDSSAHAKELAALINKPLYLVNLITYNLTGAYAPSSRQTVAKFKQFLTQSGVKVTERYRFGADIHAACGQLAGRNRTQPLLT